MRTQKGGEVIFAPFLVNLTDCYESNLNRLPSLG